MKNLFALVASLVILTSTAACAAETNRTNVVIRAEMSQGYSPFRPTLEEMNNGVEYRGEGVYCFKLTGGDFGAMKRDFSSMLAEFGKNHPGLERECFAMAKLDMVGEREIRITAYYVTYREKK